MMQPSYALLPATSYPKTVGGMCYAILGLTPIGLKQPLVTTQLTLPSSLLCCEFHIFIEIGSICHCNR